MKREARPSRPAAARESASRGSALIVVLLLSLVVSAIGGTLLMMSNSDHLISANERDAERALQAARAGVSYGYYLFQEGLLTPSASGTTFDSFASSVSDPLAGAEFAGRVVDLSTAMEQGRLFRIEVNGTYNRASRTMEMVYQVVPEAFRYGVMAFDTARFEHHSGTAGILFDVDATVRSNRDVVIQNGLTIDGAIVASGDVSVGVGARLERDVFANGVDNSGSIQGKARLLTATREIALSSPSWDRVDVFGNKYEWLNGNSSPGTLVGNAPADGQSSYTIQDGDQFHHDIFTRSGALIVDPELNVTNYVPAPMLDYRAMKAEADLGDPTYFSTATDAINYLISKRVNETHGGVAAASLRVGTIDDPEFIYVADDLTLVLTPRMPDDPSIGRIRADGLFIEGGLYVAGDFTFTGPTLRDAYLVDPPPPNYPMLYINAVPWCYPALVAYDEPLAGSPATWTPADTPAVGATGAMLRMRKVPFTVQGPAVINGVVYAQGEANMEHDGGPRELITLNGAELAWDVHDNDYFDLNYDPDVRCTRFLVADRTSPVVVSYREIR